MKFRSLLTAVSVVFVLFTPSTQAGQDRVLYPLSGGPGQGGVVRTILTLGSTYWAAIEGGGVYKSTDAGASWTASHQGIDHKVARAINVAPGNPTIMYAATNGGRGFYKSTDSGATWSVSNAGLNCTFVSNIFVAVQAPNFGRIHLATACGGNSGVYASSDQGASWALIGSPTIPSNATVFSVNGSFDGVTLRANTNTGLYASFDSGATWGARNGTNPNVLSGPNGPSVATGSTVIGSTWLAAVDGNGMFYSTDNGLNWFASTGLPANSDLAGPSVVGTDAWVVVDGVGIYKSTDSGQNWFADSTLNGLPSKATRFFFREGAGPNYWAATDRK